MNKNQFSKAQLIKKVLQVPFDNPGGALIILSVGADGVVKVTAAWVE